MVLKQYHVGCLAHASYDVLKEAEALADDLRLGPVGGRIVAEVLIGLLQSDPGAYLAVEPSLATDALRARRRVPNDAVLLGVDGVADGWPATAARRHARREQLADAGGRLLGARSAATRAG